MKLTIGAPTYNDFAFTRRWVDSVLTNIPANMKNEVRIVVVDDGSPNFNVVQTLKGYCQANHIAFIAHKENYGVPASWNTIANAFPDTEVVCIFNNDTRVISSDTFPAAVYFLEHNPFVGASSWPVIEVNRQTGKKSNPQYGEVAIVLHPTGCGFFFRRQAYVATNGFWDELISYYEEIDFGAELYVNDYLVVRLPYPAIEHWGGGGYIGHTFANNPEVEPQKRINRAFTLFVHKWHCDSSINQYPQAEIEERLVQPKRKQIKQIKYLGQNGIFLEANL